MLNKVVLMGRVVRDIELKYTQSGTAVVQFAIAVDRNYAKQGEEKQTDFISIIAWRNTAEFVAKYFRKGQLMALCGKIQTRSWEDNEGYKRFATEVIADEVFFAESKKAEQGNTQSAPKNSYDEQAVNDDNLPF